MSSIWKVYEEEIKKVILDTKLDSDTEIAKQVAEKLNLTLEYNQIREFRKYIYRHKTRILDEHEGLYNATNQVDVPHSSAKNIWIKTKAEKGKVGISAFIVNPNYTPPEEVAIKEIDFNLIFKDKITPITFNLPKEEQGFDRFVYSDVHIGMDVGNNGYALYEGKWNEEELNLRLKIAVDWILNHKKFNVLYISDLGDLLDGLDGLTVRREHHLPQNMDNQMAFDVGLRFKIKMIDSLIPYYGKIVCNNITDDNHSGSFAYIVNSAFKAYIELKYPTNVIVNIQRKFMDYYVVMDKFCFIETHGKDGGTMKFGMKPKIDDKTIKIISQFIDENFLYKKGMLIEFDKGDSHQLLVDKSCSNKFQYHNFPSFAPPSNWVKINFCNSMSGFSFRNYYLSGQVSTHDYIF